ncbi:SDR family oxidoreductase [Candidatus Aerophobetes bacterium]|nr:SDR family oxidoreductase [Candidatus Aerophobetes bacterium]
MKDILSTFSLKGKKAVVTGGMGTLGSAIAKGLGKAGAKVAICDKASTSSVVAHLKKEGIKAKGYYVDLMDKKKIMMCHNKVIKDFGRVDILVNAAGGMIEEATTSKDLSFFDLSLSGLEKMVELNLFAGVILPCQIFGKSMVTNEEGGSIINISSTSSFRPLSRVPAYSATKAAVNNFTRWLAVHFAKEYGKNVRVNAVAPGFFLTRMNYHLLLDDKDNLTERGKSIIAHTPMGEFGYPDDLTGVCIWLSSDAARFVTGALIPVDGGFSAFSGV